jgi:hypothetical protein
MFQRGNQRVSWTARGFLAVFAAVVLISLILAWTDVIKWLDFLSYCSYVKLAITLIKYVPQVRLLRFIKQNDMKHAVKCC